MDYAQRALDYLRGRRQSLGRGQFTELGIGDIYRILKDQKFIDAWTQALAIARQFNFPRVEAQALNKLGMAYNFLGDKQKALDSFSQALPILHATGDSAGEAVCAELHGHDSLRDWESPKKRWMTTIRPSPSFMLQASVSARRSP